MSQKKVDAYKAEKANRQKIMQKEKRALRIEKSIIALCCVAVIGWIGYSAYGKLTVKDAQDTAAEQTEINVSAIEDYMSGLSAE